MIRVVLVLVLLLQTASLATGQGPGNSGVGSVQAVAHGQSLAEREIRDLLERSVREALSLESATAQSQIAAFERDYARDYMSVGSNGTVYTLVDILKDIRERGPNRRKFISAEMRDTQLRIDGDTAVATYVMRYSEAKADGPGESSIRESAVFIKRDGRWLRIFEQRNNLSSSR